jgi:sterol desaturase/sphingolipid hydroxylase (fatty acid hydroxylase superfamily)
MGYALVVLAAGLAMLAVERTYPGRRFERVARWYPRAIIVNGIQAAIAYLAAATWDRWLPQAALWHLSGHGLVADALLGYVVITFVYYWWHRARHEIPLLWRLHQLHHSPCRIEVLTTFYKHPLEILANAMLSSTILYVGLGLDARGATAALLLSGVAELIYHWNIATPHWLGYLFQRPESHCVHHQRGRHRNNFSDLPLWDILFGTFENPRVAPPGCGFGPAAEERWLPMLLGRVLARPPSPASGTAER